MISKRQFEGALRDLLRELRRCHPEDLILMIDGLMAETACSENEAIRMLAKMETTTRELLEACERIGEA